MIISRIDDADNISASYRKKVNGVLPIYVILACLIMFVTMMFYELTTPRINGVRIFWAGLLLMGAVIGLGIRRKNRNRSYFMAYVIDDNEAVYMINLEKACTNNSLFGMNFKIGGNLNVYIYGSTAANMKKLPTTSYVDEFICNRRVVEYSGRVIDRVFEIEEKGEFLLVRVQLTALNKALSLLPTQRRTLRIPLTFTNVDSLRTAFEKLM